MPTLSSKTLDQLLGLQNWAMAAETAQISIKPGMIFTPAAAAPPPGLVVPVDVQALYVPDPAFESFVRLPLDLSPKSGAARPEPFASPTARPRGVHLHWALPDGLLRGSLHEHSASLSLPPLPDRWLVIRLTGQNRARQMSMRGWVIQSNSGQVHDLDTWPGAATQADAIAPERFNAVIGGGPNWTAGYDAALNRFAFHDDLSGLDPQAVQTGLASYVVIGWWSRREHDPLNDRFTAFAVSRKLAEYGWSASTAPMVRTADRIKTQARKVAAESADTKPQVFMKAALQQSVSQLAMQSAYRSFEFDTVAIVETRALNVTLMHGVIYGVPIRGTVRADQRPAPAQVDLAMSPTLERVIAGFAAKGMGLSTPNEREYAERLITAVANGSIMDLGQPDGAVRLDEAEHDDGFEAFRGPETYEDVIVERAPDGPSQGRKGRTRLARKESPEPAKAEVLWQDNRAGRTKNTIQSQRQRAAEETDRKFRDPGAPRGEEVVTRRISRPGPRYHRATAPVIGLRNYGRSPRFREDGRFSDDGTLICRWTGEIAEDIAGQYRSLDFLPRLANAAVPAHAELLIRNSHLLDPYILPWAFRAITETADRDMAGAIQNRLRAEMALRYSGQGAYDGIAPIMHKAGNSVQRSAANEQLLTFSLIEGRELSPVAVTCWAQPWSPIWLEWEVELEPGDGISAWQLGRLDYTGQSEAFTGKLALRGRAALTTGLARAYQAAIRTYLNAEAQRDLSDEGEIGESQEAALADLEVDLANADLGLVTLDSLHGVWLGLTNGPDGQVAPVPDEAAAELRAAGLPRLMANGRMRLTRARLVDTFGRWLALNTDKVILPAALETDAGGGRRAMALPPRLSLPARLMWRLTDPADGTREARLDQAEPSRGINPVAGYVLPDFIDEALEFFDRDGNPLGQVMHDPATGGLTWEGAVGREGPVANLPSEGLPAHAGPCGAIAQGMIDTDIAQRADPATAGKESPLSAFLRAVDTTMWAVDGNLAFSGATIAGLVGRPVAVVSARLWLDIPSAAFLSAIYGDQADAIGRFLTAQGVYEAVKSRAFPIRLGEVTRGNDGLYGYFLGNDFGRFHLIDKAVRANTRVSQPGLGFRSILGGIGGQVQGDFLPAPSPLDCPYIAPSEDLPLHSGQIVRLTMLMHPMARINATSGILPRKSLELLRDWVAPGMARIAPSARIGPVLIDPDKVRLPKIAAFGAEQSWTRRDSPITWRDDPILSATQAALLPDGMVSIEEGYIRINPVSDPQGGR